MDIEQPLAFPILSFLPFYLSWRPGKFSTLSTQAGVVWLVLHDGSLSSPSQWDSSFVTPVIPFFVQLTAYFVPFLPSRTEAICDFDDVPMVSPVWSEQVLISLCKAEILPVNNLGLYLAARS